MNTIIALFMLLGSTFAHRGGHGGGRGRRHCAFEVAVTQQDVDLENLMAPFKPANNDEGTDGGDEGSDVGGEEESDVVAAAISKTTCVMRGLDAEWPHEDAETVATRRLLRRGTRSKAAFNVTDGSIGLVSKTAHDRSFTCYNQGEVTMEFTSYSLTKSTGEVVTFPEAAATEDDPRRALRRNHGGSDNDDDDEEEVNFPTVTLTFMQKNTFGDASAEIVVSVLCRPWYKYSRSEETCGLKGLTCYDGDYTYGVTETDGGEQTVETEWFRGMKCSDDETFLSRWEECAAEEI